MSAGRRCGRHRAPNAQAWRFVVLRSPRTAGPWWPKAGGPARLEVIEPVYGMSRPSDDWTTADVPAPTAQRMSCTIRAGEFTSVSVRPEALSDGVGTPAGRVRSFRRCRISCWAARASRPGRLSDQLGRPMAASSCCGTLSACPDDWMLAGHIVVGWPKGRHGTGASAGRWARWSTFDRWDG